jgi:hypothetical protein
MSANSYEDLKAHIGHKVVVVGYGHKNGIHLSDPLNVAIECEDCNEVLLDFNQKDEEA